MGTVCNLIGNSMAVIRNCKPELVVVPFILDPEILCGDREECSFYLSDFFPKKISTPDRSDIVATKNIHTGKKSI
jgi:hypothetical protein